uniref:RxLR effector candidate protein n=1 Tax=Hyaloperonospora arabidopsidis (strain Emoy2) TaxID=559515 RepID=M4C317_HYAAE
MIVQPAQLLAYKAAVLSRTAPDLPPGVRAEIGRLFPDTAGEIGRAWVRIWWIACSIYFATLRAQRSRWVHNHEETTADQAKSELRQKLLRLLQAVAVREYRLARDEDDYNFSG